MFDIVRYRGLYFLASLLVILGGLSMLFVRPGLSWSIEFTSGATATVLFEEPVPGTTVRAAVEGLGYPGAVVQGLGVREQFIRLPADENVEAQRAALEAAVRQVGSVAAFDFAIVSPAVARETVRNGLIAVALAVVGILIYVIWAFRGVPHAARYGIAATVALGHDVLMAFAVAAVAVKFVHIELSTMFLVGVLTLLGYSINDTIVVFDRVRENLLRQTVRDLPATINFSVLETMGRSLNTSFTTLLSLLALWVLGPVTIRDFLVVMLVGVTAGTYSSIFTASQILVAWETRSLGSLPRWVPIPRRAASGTAPQP